jgi:hypothetical protein
VFTSSRLTRLRLSLPPRPPSLFAPQFLEAARVEGHAQAPALAALGRYFARVERRGDQAERCFKRALAIDPTVDVAGARRESLEECVGTED